MQIERYLLYWGKAQPRPDAESDWHPLAYHCLDVAAVGEQLLLRDPALLVRLSRVTGLPEEVARRWFVTLLALHDAGKFAGGFQALVPELLAGLQQRHDGRTGTRHDAAGWTIWDGELRKVVLDSASHLLGPDRSEAEACLDVWMRAIAGHHGRPVAEDAIVEQLFSEPKAEPDRAVARAFTAAILDLLAPHPDGALLGTALDPPSNRAAKRGSWLVAGLAALCDWIGSNQTWFPYRSPDLDLTTYWTTCAVPQADAALAAAGILPARPRLAPAADDVLPPGREPTPLQDWAASCDLGNGPQLFVLEDLTGSGKTEAALILARRLMADNRADGLFLALPTMATANAMYDRLSPVCAVLFEPDSSPSLVLSHSARDLKDSFRQSILPVARPMMDDYGDGSDTASAACAAWIADDRRKAFLADAGIGTVDQVMLAAMPAKHQAMRLAGLARKVLIVDEVHAHDAYMQGILKRVLELHAQLGGSAILLSATLPLAQRRDLADGFARGLGHRRPPDPAAMAYPLATRMAGSGLTEEAVAPRPGLPRRVEVRRLADAAAAVERVVAHARAERCVVWIRNTVADALDGLALVREAASDLDPMLFHARFAMADRLVIEGEVLRRFGKDGTPAARAGRILVCTQVLQESLDCDFDAMVTDLAPVDALVQRAGRLWRHPWRQRDGGPCLEVVSPEPRQDAGPAWYASTFPRAAKVYPDHAALWLSAHVLFEEGAIDSTRPGALRHLVESVYGEEADDAIPKGLALVRNFAEGERRAERSQGFLSALNPREGYRLEGPWEDDARTPTRLGEPTTILRLARWMDGWLEPWAEDRVTWRAWRLSEVSVRRAWVAGEAEHPPAVRDAIDRLRQEWPDRAAQIVVVPLMRTSASGEWVGDVTDGNSRPITVAYDNENGLRPSS